MSVLTINAFPSTATITATYNEETITGIGQVVIEANDSTVVSYTVEAQQCTSKSGTFTISGDMTEAVALNYIGSVSVDTWVPSTGRDTFPTHIAMLGKGGWRSVESNDERDAIPSARREAGMSVYVTSEKKLYILNSDLVTWSLFSAGGVIEMPTPSETELNNIVQYIGETTEDYTQGYFYKCISDGADPATYSWERIDVQPHQDISGKLDKVTDQTSVVYGVDENGNQTTYDVNDFGQIDNVAIHGVDQTITDKRVDLSVVEQYDETTMPVASVDLLGRVIQYIGQDTNTLIHDYFYECVEVTNSNFTIWTDNEGDLSHFYEPQYYNKETFENYVHPTESTTITLCCKIVSEDPWEVMWYLEDDPNPDNPTEARPSWYGWEYTPDDLDRTTGANDTDQIKFIYTTNITYEWVRKDVQPNTAIWGSITGTLSEQTDLQDALDAKQDTLTAGTNITITEDAQTGDLVISSVAQESFFRGRFENWSNVPTDPTYYEQDLHNPPSKIPEANDYIVVNDMSDWRPVNFDDSFEVWNNSKNYQTIWSWKYDNVITTKSIVYNPDSSLKPEDQWFEYFGPHNEVLVRRTSQTVSVIAQTTLRYNDTVYTVGQTLFRESLNGDGCDSTHPHTIEFSNSTERKEGTWRMRYQGVWDTDGKNGWKPEYQIENVLPIATSTEQGITKLYNTTGTNTDGAVDQNTVTNELGKRVLQVTEFPEASASNEGQLVQFIGTGGSGTTGWFYTSTQYQIPYSLTVEGDSDVTVSTYNAETFISQLSDTTVDSTTVFTYDGTDWKDSDSNVVDLTDWGITISGTPVNNSTITGIYVAPSTGYRWVQTDTQPTEEYHESFFRGPFYSWSNVPDVGHEDQYYEDFYGNHRPGLTDYIVITDPEDYVSEETAILELKTHSTGGSTASMDVTVLSTGEVINYFFENVSSWTKISNTDFEIGYRAPGTSGDWGIRNLSNPFTVDGVVYPVGSVYYWGYTTRVDKSVNGYHVYRGMWRFSYASNSWDSEGKNGWKPEYQIENVLPIADSQTLGIAKLYTTTGQHTDGSVTQKLVTDELGKKQDTLTEGTGISIDENNVISATFSESYFRGKFSTWNTVPTDYRNYYPDYTGSTKPTRTDYMVVEDPSSYVKPGDPIYIYQLPWQQPFAYVRIVFGATDVTLNHQQVHENPPIIGTVGNQMRVEYDNYQWKIIPLDIPVIVDGVEKPINEVAYSWSYNSGSSEYLQKELNFKGTSGYVGTWRFSYQSDNWDATGKNGWYPEYQIEDILPIATETDAGITKLYTTTGSNTDGTMDQNSITTELNKKQNNLVAGNNITIDANSKIDAADKTLVSFVIWEDEE